MKLQLNGCELQLRRCGNIVSKVDLSTCAGGGEDKDEQELSISGTSVTISGGNTLDFAQLVKDGETLTTLDSITVNGTNLEIKYTGENGTQVTKSADLKSLVENAETLTSILQPTYNSTTGAFVIKYKGEDGVETSFTTTILPQAVVVDEQALTSDTTGNVELIFTPTTQPSGSVDYSVKGSLKLATTTPLGNANEIKVNSSNQLFVEPTKMSNTRFVATANQTSFTLSFTPLGVVQFFRNGAYVDSSAYSVSGTTVTYVPANNSTLALGTIDAGDIINVYGISK
jgi:hypothetical protein